MLRSDVLDWNDLKPGMKLKGTVRNVADFGAFVDIGVHQDGLVHISQLCNRYVKHPSEVVTVGDIVDVARAVGRSQKPPHCADHEKCEVRTSIYDKGSTSRVLPFVIRYSLSLYLTKSARASACQTRSPIGSPRPSTRADTPTGRLPAAWGQGAGRPRSSSFRQRKPDRRARGVQNQVVHRGHAACDDLDQLNTERYAKPKQDGALCAPEIPPEQRQQKTLRARAAPRCPQCWRPRPARVSPGHSSTAAMSANGISSNRGSGRLPASSWGRAKGPVTSPTPIRYTSSTIAPHTSRFFHDTASAVDAMPLSGVLSLYAVRTVLVNDLGWPSPTADSIGSAAPHFSIAT